MASPWQARGRLALVLVTFGLVVAAVVMLLEREPTRSRSAAEPERAPQVSRRTPSPTPSPDARPDCPPVGAACHSGDVWLMDACGGARERLEVCDGGCDDGSCRDVAAAPSVDPEACVGLSELGVCEADVAVGCAGGQPFRIDCAAAGKRCVMTSEGATCRAPSADDCAAGSPPSCVGDLLRYCHDGRWASLDCRSQGASCDPDSGRCLQVVAASEGDCGACGCPTGPSGDEVCDGRDNDGDGEVDEDVTCAPVPLIFFVVGDRPGASREELEALVAGLDRTFAGDPEEDSGRALGLRFTILDVVRLDVPAWVDPDEAAWSQMAQSERLHPKRDAFYIPIAMVGSIATGDVPKAGVATIPNGTCGGQRRGAANQLGVGLVMVADRRSPTTLAHEIGHFLGLCHTHADDADVTQRVVVDADGEPLDCAEPCRTTGDGLCDTPADPGIDACAVDRACEVTCPDDQRPDPRNIMSYYTWCRRQFTAEQLALVRTSLWLRRGWHRCLGGLPDESCPCTPGLRECPEAMSCWPHSGGDSCWLDGPLPPGAGPCTQHLECSLGALCIAGPDASTCARPCLLSQPGCTCVDLGLEHRMCKEDLGARGR